MSYGQMRNGGGVTMLDQLPELDDLEAGGFAQQYGNGQMMGPQPAQNNFPPHGAGLPPGSAKKYTKYIRGNHQMTPGSGMMNSEYYNHPGGYGGPGQHGEQYGTLEPQMTQGQGEMIVTGPPPAPEPHPALQINCVDIARHIQECPICSKFYSNDKTVYIIAIVVLSIVCLLLLKRVLNV